MRQVVNKIWSGKEFGELPDPRFKIQTLILDSWFKMMILIKWLLLVYWTNSVDAGTVPLLKSCHRRRRLFLITGGRHILHELGDHYSLFHQPPIKIFLLYAQKGGQMRQSNLPPLFSRRWSAAYWAEIWPAIVTSISSLSNSYLSVWFSSYFLVYMHFWLFWPA